MFSIYLYKMGNVIVSLDDKDEQLLRNIAKEKYSGKKGSLSRVVAEGVHELANKEKKLKVARHQIRLMKSGFNLGLRNKKAFDKRSEIYE